MTDTREATDEEYATIEYLAGHDLNALVIEAPADTGDWETALDEDHKRAHLSAWEAALKDPDAPAGVRQLAQVQVDRWEEVCQGEGRKIPRQAGPLTSRHGTTTTATPSWPPRSPTTGPRSTPPRRCRHDHAGGSQPRDLGAQRGRDSRAGLDGAG